MTIFICHPEDGADNFSRSVILETVWHPEKGRERSSLFLSYVGKEDCAYNCIYIAKLGSSVFDLKKAALSPVSLSNMPLVFS